MQADIGSRLAVRAWPQGEPTAEKRSELTLPVLAVIPTPTPPGEPTPDPEPSPTPDPDPGTPPPADPAPPPAPGAVPPPDQAAVAGPPTPARLMTPFPIVRIKGALAPGGARVSLLQVRGPRRATVSVRCEGRDCPRARLSTRPGRIGALERFLRAGTRITIRVARPDEIGKHVRIVIRDGKVPFRRDACLLPGATGPSRCPAG